MSKHRKLLLCFTALMIALFIIQPLVGFFNWWYLVISSSYILFLFYASMNIQFNFFIDAISFGKTDEKKVALTFDDGPDPENTSKVLDILKRYNIKATFFCIGKKIKPSDQTLKRIDKEGHIIGNHSYVHTAFFDFFPPFLVENDLIKTIDRIEKNIGKKPLLFRPPFGVTTPSMALAVKKLGLTTIGWNNRSFDTSTRNDEIILQRIEKSLKPGGIILLHDILPWHQTLLPRIIERINELSYEIVQLTELLDINAYDEIS